MSVTSAGEADAIHASCPETAASKPLKELPLFVVP